MECLERWQLFVIEEIGNATVPGGLQGEKRRPNILWLSYLSFLQPCLLTFLFCVKFRNEALKGKGREGQNYTQQSPREAVLLQGPTVWPGATNPEFPAHCQLLSLLGAEAEMPSCSGVISVGKQSRVPTKFVPPNPWIWLAKGIVLRVELCKGSLSEL